MVAKSVTGVKRSIIQKYFTKDIYIELLKIIRIPDIDNNTKGELIHLCLKDHGIPFENLGSGTNRIGILIDGYAVKIALDIDGKIDNRREMLYTKKLQPYVIKVYECIPDGLIAVSEYVRYFTIDDFYSHKREMASILREISKTYLIGDCGITKKNYINWGTRSDGTICILDFAYIYDVKFGVFKCSCGSDGYLKYDSTYVNLICPQCNRSYKFGELRSRITSEQQEEEIGDIRRLSYNITEPEESVTINPEFEPKSVTKEKGKKLSPKEQQYKAALKKYKKEKGGC